MAKSTLMEYRQRKGMSPEDAAAALGVQTRTVLKWESGKTYPDENKLKALGELYEVNVSALARDDDSEEDDDSDFVSSTLGVFVCGVLIGYAFSSFIMGIAGGVVAWFGNRAWKQWKKKK